MTSRLASIVVTLDMETIQDAHLCINADIVKESILQTPKIKLKQQVAIFIGGVRSVLTPLCIDIAYHGHVICSISRFWISESWKFFPQLTKVKFILNSIL